METRRGSDFKAQCLALLDRVRATGERLVTVLKRRERVSEPRRATRDHARYPQDELKGTATVVGDIISPAVPEEDWESLTR